MALLLKNVTWNVIPWFWWRSLMDILAWMSFGRCERNSEIFFLRWGKLCSKPGIWTNCIPYIVLSLVIFLLVLLISGVTFAVWPLSESTFVLVQVWRDADKQLCGKQVCRFNFACKCLPWMTMIRLPFVSFPLCDLVSHYQSWCQLSLSLTVSPVLKMLWDCLCFWLQLLEFWCSLPAATASCPWFSWHFLLER